MNGRRMDVTIGERTFSTLTNTLIESGYFKKIIFKNYDAPSGLEESGNLLTFFLDADADLFAHVLKYLRTGRMPLFWTRSEGFDLDRYARLKNLASYLAIPKIVCWIKHKRYESVIKFTVVANTYIESVPKGKSQIATSVADPSDVTVSIFPTASAAHRFVSVVEKQIQFNEDQLIPPGREQ